MSSPRRWVWGGLLCASLSGACAEPDAPEMHPDDVLPRAGFRFERDTLLSDADMRDVTFARVDAIQRSLDKTRYNQPSFLATYRSHGVLASQALERSAKAHRISPRVLLVFSQLVGQLVSARSYPLPPSRVEYAFGCGCTIKETCEQSAGGYGEQVECLAKRLAASMATLEKGGTTPAGYAVGKVKVTLDGVRVTPSNAATAAVYDVLQDVSEGKGGAWLFAVLASKEGWL
ncbi:MAG: hypothetical protein R3F34_20300 [Planctomycetota bacterium]